MEGGIIAWNGLVASGPPEAGMAYFPLSARPEVLISLAWALEDGTRRFYVRMTESVKEADAAGLFRALGDAEEHHKSVLDGLFREIAADDYRTKGIDTLIAGQSGAMMEGGVRVDEAVAWTTDKKIADILDLAVSLEANSYDLYIKMDRALSDSHSKRVFQVLSEEERNHLNRLTALIERRPGA